MKKSVLCKLAVVYGLWSLSSPATTHAQAIFQNNDTSCEEHDLIAEFEFLPNENVISFLDSAITCGRFNDDSAVIDPTHGGNPDFPDCVTQADAVMESPEPQLTNSILTNTAAHGDNCVNAGGANPQFQAPDFVELQEFDEQRMGSIVHGNLNGGEFEDLVMVEGGTLTDITSSRALGFLLSQAGGGFGNPTMVSGEALLEPSGQVPYQTFPVALFFGAANDALMAQSSLALLDCDGDGVDEAAVSVKDANDSQVLGLIVVQNDGSGLVDNPAPAFFPLPATVIAANDDDVGIPVLTGDFTGDGVPDLVAVISDFSMVTPAGSAVLCPGDGACGFDCPASPDANEVVLPAGSVYFSATAGDFNGDGRRDVALPELSSLVGAIGQLRYLLNDGGNLDTWQQVVVPFNPPGVDVSAAFVITTGRFTVTAVQNQIDEVAGNAGNTTGVTGSISVNVVPTDGMGAFGTPRLLTYASLPPDAAPLAGITAEDFDRCGGDDIMSITQSSDPTAAQVSLFLNENEVPVAAAAIAPTIGFDFAVPITGSCTDPTNDEQTFQWSVLTAPPGATVTFATDSGTLLPGETDTSTTVTVDTSGDYTFELNCVDFCGLESAATVTTTAILLTQGANLFNCSLNSDLDGKGNPMIWMLLMMIPAVFLFYRLGQKRWFIPTLMVLLTLGLSSPASALTNSVYVNTFAPTVDDSEYFTVYNSPTMLQRNFHVGFFLDYAHRPYEFGTANFNRVSGIVDHLLDANVVGSYAVLDWLSVGLVIPVTLYEGLNSPLLGLNESNFALGDVQLVLKFRLLNREKHGVGIAIVPFASFPTSTNSTDFLGNGSFGGGAKLVIDGRIKDRVSLALNVGGNLRSQFIDVSGQDIDDQFLASLGVSVDIIKRTFKWIGEVQTSTVFKDFFSNRRTSPAEARMGFRYTWANNHDINVGGGMGFSNGIGQPDYRIFLGYAYTKRPLAEVEVPPPPMSEIQVGDELTLKDKIFFEFDKDKIRDISMPTMDKIAAFLKAHPEVTKIRIDGYTCDLGTEKYNLGLSNRRANSAGNYLEGQGLDRSRIGTVTGYGEANPMVPNVDEAHREQNRRVQIFVEAVDQSLATGVAAPATTEETTAPAATEAAPADETAK